MPCRRRLDHFESAAEQGESTVGGEDGEDGWLRTGGEDSKGERQIVGEVRTLDGSGNIGEGEGDVGEEEIPDMEDEEDDDEAIIREGKEGGDRSYVEPHPVHSPRKKEWIANARWTATCAPTTST